MYNPNDLHHPKYYNKATNTYIRGLYSPGFSSLVISLYRTNLILKFTPYLGKENRGFDQYNKKIFLSTSMTYEGAAYFYLAAMSILAGEESDKQIVATLPCNNGATLTFEYKPDQNNRMTAYLIINKNNVNIPFRFNTQQAQVNVDGQMVKKFIQAGGASLLWHLKDT